jgi:NADP+-dependent farnesol dehydrogenase
VNCRKATILNDNPEVDEQITEIINTNFTGLVYVTRQAYRLINKSNDYGLICNINSIAGHNVQFPLYGDQNVNVYHGTKHAVTATTEILRQELICMGNNKIRITVEYIFNKLNFNSRN